MFRSILQPWAQKNRRDWLGRPSSPGRLAGSGETPMIRSKLIFLAILLLASPSVWAAEVAQRAPSQTEKILQDIMKLPAGERIKKLIDGARKEGSLVWYAPDREDLTELRIEFFKEIYPDSIQKFVTPRIRSDVMIDRLLT